MELVVLIEGENDLTWQLSEHADDSISCSPSQLTQVSGLTHCHHVHRAPMSLCSSLKWRTSASKQIIPMEVSAVHIYGTMNDLACRALTLGQTYILGPNHVLAASSSPERTPRLRLISQTYRSTSVLRASQPGPLITHRSKAAPSSMTLAQSCTPSFISERARMQARVPQPARRCWIRHTEGETAIRGLGVQTFIRGPAVHQTPTSNTSPYCLRNHRRTQPFPIRPRIADIVFRA